MKNLLLIFVWTIFFSCSGKEEHTASSPEFTSATIEGNFALMSGNEIRLEGFKGLNSYIISTTAIDEKGNFKLSYSPEDYGVGYLIYGEDKPFILILSGEDIEIAGEALSAIETIRVIKGQENQWFEQYAQEHPKREQALSAWLYLEKIYTQDPLFSNQHVPNQAIQTEKNASRLKTLHFWPIYPKKVIQDGFCQPVN
jgi:hypothetical protein